MRSKKSTTSEETFLRRLQQISPGAVVFSSMAPSNATMPPAASPAAPVICKLPSPLTALKKQVYLSMSKEELKAACEEVFKSIAISREESVYLEECTRLQSQSQLWFTHRVGRITASKFFAVARASLDPPPAHLTKQLMERSKLSSYIPAIRWGIDHEDIAREAYLEFANEKHNNLQCSASGLHVNPFPHLGATPDGLIRCDCCGEGLIEIKCPYKHRDKRPHDISDSKFYLKQDEDGEVFLQHNHEYFYQVQGQLAICEKEYCDFICWTPEGIHVERILPHTTHYMETKPALDSFFIKVLLPLLLTGKTFFDETPQTTNQLSHKSPTTYCWCGGEEAGRMVACDNPQCRIEWFHFGCVGLTRKPRGKWFCSETCRGELELCNS